MTAARSPFTWSAAARTHPGVVRRQNEDACLERPEIGLWAVADGMGGHSSGDLASRLIVEALQEIGEVPDLEREVSDRLAGVNRKLVELAEAEAPDTVIGSTVVVLLMAGETASGLWAGDSRIYLYRGGALRQLTRDHSQVEAMIESGLLKRDDPSAHALANVITRAVGADLELVLDRLQEPLQEDDVFLLCSDGLTKMVTDTEIAEVLAHGDSEESVQALLHLTLVRGARDNVTIVVVQVHAATLSPG